MKTIFDEVIAAWASTIDEIGLLAEYQQKATTVKYATEHCFKLEDYTPDAFPPGNELLHEIPAEAPLVYEEYSLDANGLPCYCRTINKDGQPISAGFYRYAPEKVEFVQYNLRYRSPHVFKRMEFAEDRKIAFLHAVANGGGFKFAGMTPQQAIDAAKADKNSMFLSVQEYEYENGRIVRDISHNRAPGAGDYDLTGHYTYDQNGKLIEIKDVSPQGAERLRYAAWDEQEGLEGLADRLAHEMAQAIVTALLETDIKTPLAILQLTYHYADVYMPTLNPLSVTEKEEVTADNTGNVWEGLFVNDNYLDHTRPKGIEKTFTQFMNQVRSHEAHVMARGMLQKTSALLTASRLFDRIPVDPEFFAYAIDHSIEGHDSEEFKEILLNCGMPEQQYEEWDKRGWLR